jgi:transcription antitermination factor NusG
MPDTLRWFALTARHQHERQTALALGFKGWETLAPMYRASRVWSDRTKDVEFPLFAGYVFCRFAAREKGQVLSTPGVVKIVSFGGAPMAVEDREIAEIQAVMRSGLAVRPWPFLRAGDRVRVERGPLRGIEGTLLRDDGALRLVVSVELLQRSISVELEADMIAPAGKPQAWRPALLGA